MAVKYGIDRDECDELAFESHRRAGLARDKGFFDQQTVPFMVCTDKKKKQYTEVYQDEGMLFVLYYVFHTTSVYHIHLQKVSDIHHQWHRSRN